MSTGKAGLEGLRINPSALQDFIIRVVLILSIASPGATGPVLSVAIRECSSQCGSYWEGPKTHMNRGEVEEYTIFHPNKNVLELTHFQVKPQVIETIKVGLY